MIRWENDQRPVPKDLTAWYRYIPETGLERAKLGNPPGFSVVCVNPTGATKLFKIILGNPNVDAPSRTIPVYVAPEHSRNVWIEVAVDEVTVFPDSGCYAFLCNFRIRG